MPTATGNDCKVCGSKLLLIALSWADVMSSARKMPRFDWRGPIARSRSASIHTRAEISAQPTVTEGGDPEANHAPQAPDRATEYSIADFNVENLYDYRDNPFSGCDFTGNSGCPI